MNELLAFVVMLGRVTDLGRRHYESKNGQERQGCECLPKFLLSCTHHWQFIDDLVGDAASRRRERFHFSSRKKSTGYAVSRSMTTAGKACYRPFMKFMFHLSRDQVRRTCCSGEALTCLGFYLVEVRQFAIWEKEAGFRVMRIRGLSPGPPAVTARSLLCIRHR